MEENWFVVMHIDKWDETEVTIPCGTVALSIPEEYGIGFLRVFDTRENAEKHCEGLPISAVRRRV